MFTGIVQGTGTVAAITDRDALRRLVVDLPPGRGAGLEIGASVSVCGVCLTAVDIDGDRASFDAIDETLRLTTLGALAPGDRVNIERAARFGDEIGGHALSGHVWGTVEVVAVASTETNHTIVLRAPADAMPCLLPKGYVGLDGCSLTIGRVDTEDRTFRVHLIPETLRVTTLGERVPGDRLNLELDAMTQAVVATVERVLASRVDPLAGG
jgi:riboflavin synthase